MLPLRPGALGYLLLLLCCLLAACARVEPEQRLREAIGALQQAVETREAATVSDWLADDFVGPDGLDRAGARRMAQMMFLRHRQVGLTLGPRQVTLHGEQATVEFDAVLAGGSDRMLPDAASVYRVRSGWRRTGGDWRMTSIEWSRTL